jgi:hypothetical protein
MARGWVGEIDQGQGCHGPWFGKRSRVSLRVRVREIDAMAR